VTLRSKMPSQPVLVNVDADLLKQAIINVVQNGAQAMTNGGSLDVLLETAQNAAIVRILDEGVGIPDDIREKIFDLYFTTKSEGSGIGLAMTYRILQLHHGSVEVESKVDHGTEFRFRIPLSAAELNRRNLQPALEREQGLGE
jgi:signal transduction histidine kinase